MIKLYLIALLALYTGYKLKRSVITQHIDKEYDFIIVGGGTTGCALAGRLSENQNIKILVLEAGGSDLSVPSIRVPLFEPLIDTSADWKYRTVPQKDAAEAIAGRIDSWNRGKILGGTSSMNHLIYHRSSPHDFDSWEDHGAAGWGWKGVEPFFTKAEGAADDSLSKRLGKNGPLHLERAYAPPLMNDILEEAAAEIGIKRTDYIDQLEGFSEITATKQSGLRVNSVDAYLRDNFPERKDHLHVLIGAHVTQIVFQHDSADFSRAVGVKFTKNGREFQVRARKEVILSAGVVETPHLLMLSGIGPQNHLEEHGIRIVKNLTGVGSNLQDHLRMLYHIYSDNLPENTAVTTEQEEKSKYAYTANGTGPLQSSFVSAFIHHKTPLAGTSLSASSMKRPFPEIQVMLYPKTTSISDFQSSSERETNRGADLIQEVTKAVRQRNGIISSFLIVVGMQHPKSAGTIRLNSSDPIQYPLIDPKYLSDKDDVEVYAEGLKVVERLLNTKVFKKWNAKEVFQPFCKNLDSGFPRNDKYYHCWLRKTAASAQHPCCTARIGSDIDKGAVVDERLRVYGVKGLRVADASVMPHQVSGNLQATCYMIAEKAAQMIKDDWLASV